MIQGKRVIEFPQFSFDSEESWSKKFQCRNEGKIIACNKMDEEGTGISGNLSLEK